MQIIRPIMLWTKELVWREGECVVDVALVISRKAEGICEAQEQRVDLLSELDKKLVVQLV